MKLEDARAEVVEYCRKLERSTLSSGTSGNISVFDSEQKLMAISPSSMDYHCMAPQDVVLMDLDGTVVEGDRRPSSEWTMHLACYRARVDVRAVVHTHSPAATTLAVLGLELPAVHYMIALSGKSSIPLAPYHLYGTAALGEAAADALQGGYACLLKSLIFLSVFSARREAVTLAMHPFSKTIRAFAISSEEDSTLTPTASMDFTLDLQRYRMISMS